MVPRRYLTHDGIIQFVLVEDVVTVTQVQQNAILVRELKLKQFLLLGMIMSQLLQNMNTITPPEILHIDIVQIQAVRHLNDPLLVITATTMGQ